MPVTKDKVESAEQQILNLHTAKGISFSRLATVMQVSTTHLHYILKGAGDQKRPLLAHHIQAINAEYKLKIPVPKS